jgi:tight adherence protein B
MSTAAAISARAAPMLGFFAVALVFLWGLWMLISSSARRSLLAERGGLGTRRRRRLDEVLEVRLARTYRGADLGARLRSAGTERTAAEFLLMAVGLAGAAFVFTRLLFPTLLALVAAALAWWGCFAWLERRLEKRKEEFVAQLPEVARLLSNGAAAGLAMPAAIELAAREIDSPAHDELQTVIDELQLGRSLPEALASLQRRLPSREISVLLTTLIIQQRTGGDAVTALRELSGTLDQRRQTLREVATLLAGAIYTSYVVPLLGVGALLMLNAVNSHVLHDMTTQALGIAALVCAGAMYVLGWTAIRKTTRIEL